MTRLLLSVLIVTVSFVALQPLGYAQQPVQTLQPTHLSIQATDLTQLRTWDAFVIEGSRTGDLRRRSLIVDPLLPERVVERFDQFYSGVQIWGADLVRDSEGGIPRSIFGELASPDLLISTDPALSLEDARVALLRLGGTDARLLVWPQLVISRIDSGEYRLAYTAVISGNGDVIRAFVDAQTGTELMRYSDIQRQQYGPPAIGTGMGVLGDQKKLSVENQAGTYIAFDRHRPPIIETFDMGGDLRLAKLLLFNLLPSPLRYLASDEDNVWTDVAVVDAHVHVSWTYDYYYKRFGRSGFDGKDSPLNILVNAVTQEDAVSLPPSDRVFAVNAFWCGWCANGEGVMVFGNGMPPGYVTSSGKNFTYFAGGLDIAAHELTHGVTNATSNLIYRNESGALNEAFSDIMSKGVEFYYHTPGSGRGQADYVLGKDIARGVWPGVPNGIRSLANPQLYGDPDHYGKYQWRPVYWDNGGVHHNSGIANHAFYLAIEGGTNRTSGFIVEGVGSEYRAEIEKVFYRAFTTLLPRNATFSMAAAATKQAARDLYHGGVTGGDAIWAVADAWAAVGLPHPDALTRVASDSVGAGKVRRRTFTPQQTSPNWAYTRGEVVTTINLRWDNPVKSDLDLYVTKVNCPHTQTSCVLGKSTSGNNFESVSWPNERDEAYWVTVENYRGESAKYTLDAFTCQQDLYDGYC